MLSLKERCKINLLSEIQWEGDFNRLPILLFSWRVSLNFPLPLRQRLNHRFKYSDRKFNCSNDESNRFEIVSERSKGISEHSKGVKERSKGVKEHSKGVSERSIPH